MIGIIAQIYKVIRAVLKHKVYYMPSIYEQIIGALMMSDDCLQAVCLRGPGKERDHPYTNLFDHLYAVQQVRRNLG